jgi:peptide/nickel transport system substrate-binding protein
MITTFIKATKVYQIIKKLSKKERFIFLGAIIIFTATCAIYGTLFIGRISYTVADEGGTFREGAVGQPVFINPIMYVTDVDRDISRLVFSSVYQVADSIERSEDGKTWNVRLKENVFWHDGERLTSDDIIFTLEVIQDPDSRSPLNASFQGVTAERVSELELQFSLQNAYAFFENDHLETLRIIPKHIFGNIPVQNIKLSKYGLSPIGSGPYKIVSFDKNDNGVINSFKLEENKRYFDGDPFIKTFTFKFYKDSSELIDAYNIGQIDGFGLSTGEPLSKNEVTIRNIKYYFETPRYYALFINQSLAPEKIVNLDVRKALNATVDRERIIKDVFLSEATELYGPTTLTKKSEEEYDPALLKDLEINIIVPEEPFLIKTAEIIKENWQSYGAIVNLNILSIKTIQEEILKNSDYEFILFGNIIKESQDLFAFWHSSRRFYPDQNLSLYQNKDADKLLEGYRRNFNTDERTEMLNEISNAIRNDVPAIFVCSPKYVYVTIPRLRGISDATVINTSDDRFVNIEDWHLKTKQTLKNPEKE